MNIVDLKFVPQGTPDLNIQAFDCGRKSVNDFFHSEAQDYQDELFGKTYYFCLSDSPSDIVAGFTVANASIFTKTLGKAEAVTYYYVTSNLSFTNAAAGGRGVGGGSTPFLHI